MRVESEQAGSEASDGATTTAVGDPAALHLLLGNLLERQGVIDVSSTTFAALRAHAERLARREDADPPTLDRVHAELADALGTDVSADVLTEAEMALECRLRRPAGVPSTNRAGDVDHSPGAGLNRYERILEDHRDLTGGLSSLMAGASRNARLRHTTPDPRQAALTSVAAGVMAPTLTAWVLWIIRRAQSSGCQRIYYMSRDGQIRVDIAQRLEKKLQTGIEHRYLYGGRLASTSLRSVDASFSIHDLSEEERAELLPAHLRGREAWDRMIYGDQEELRRALEAEDAQAKLAQATERARQLLMSYLRQEGWDSSGRYALVDVGWRGRIPAALASTLAGTDIRMPELLLYFGLEKGARDRMPAELASHLEAYFFDRSRDKGYVRRVPGLQLLIEMFCVADHASVTGYRRDPEGRIEPIIDGAFDEAIAWGLPHVRRVVEDFVDDLVLDDDLVNRWSDVRPAIDELLRAFWLSPTPDEVDAWGRFPVASDEVHSDHYEMAKPITAGWAAQAVKTRVRRLRSDAGEPGVGHIWYWPAGVLANSALPYRGAYGGLTLVKRELPRMRRRAAEVRARLTASAKDERRP